MLTACYFELRSELRAHRFQASMTLDTEDQSRYFVHFRSWFTRGSRSSWKTPTAASLVSAWADNINRFEQPGPAVLAAVLTSNFDWSAYVHPTISDIPPSVITKNMLAHLTKGNLHEQYGYELFPIEYFTLKATDNNLNKLSKYKTAPWPIINRAKAAYIKKGIDF